MNFILHSWSTKEVCIKYLRVELFNFGGSLAKIVAILDCEGKVRRGKENNFTMTKFSELNFMLRVRYFYVLNLGEAKSYFPLEKNTFACNVQVFENSIL